MDTLPRLTGLAPQPSLRELRFQQPSQGLNATATTQVLAGTPPAVYAPFSLNYPNIQTSTSASRLNVLA